MVPNLKLAKNMIKLHRRGGGSGPGIDFYQTGLKSVVFPLFLRGGILPYFEQI